MPEEDAGGPARQSDMRSPEAAIISAEAAVRAAHAAELDAQAAVKSAKWAGMNAFAAAAGAIISVGAVVVGLAAINSGREAAQMSIESEEARLFETERIASLAALAETAALYRTEVRRGRNQVVAGDMGFHQFDGIRQERYTEWDAALAVARLQDDGDCEDEFAALQTAVNAMNGNALRLESRSARVRSKAESDRWTELGLAVLKGTNGVVRSCRRSGA